jgi:hypothetical protein
MAKSMTISRAIDYFIFLLTSVRSLRAFPTAYFTFSYTGLTLLPRRMKQDFPPRSQIACRHVPETSNLFKFIYSYVYTMESHYANSTMRYRQKVKKMNI